VIPPTIYDLQSAILVKMGFNKGRPYRHDGKVAWSEGR